MAQETVDYSAMLADARAKRAALDTFITSLENAQALGALGQSGTATGGGLASGPAIELPMGALRGKSVPSAIKLYLAACRKNQTTREIAAGLKEGGVQSTSKNFEIIVNNAMRTLKKTGVVLQFKDGWGLAELYPAAIRSRLAQQGNADLGKKAGKKKGKRGKRKAMKDAGTENRSKAANPNPESRVQEMPRAV